jgi:hypothetical protein
MKIEELKDSRMFWSDMFVNGCKCYNTHLDYVWVSEYYKKDLRPDGELLIFIKYNGWHYQEMFTTMCLDTFTKDEFEDYIDDLFIRALKQSESLTIKKENNL